MSHSSKMSHNPQAFILVWKPFIRLFQMLSLSHYSLFHSQKRIGRLMYFVVFSVVCIMVKIYTLKDLYLQDKSVYKNSPLMYYVSCMSIISHSGVLIVVYLETFSTRKSQEKIYQKFQEIFDIFAMKLDYITDFDQYRKKCILHASIYYITIISILISSCIHSPVANWSIFIFILTRVVLVSINLFRRIQIIIHFNLATTILRDLKILLEKQQQSYRFDSNEVALSRGIIRCLHNVYSNVWLIMKLIDNCFGWTLVIFLIEFTIDSINSLYQYYLNIKIYNSMYKIIRKYSFSISFRKN